MDKINFDETKQSQLPLVEMLINMGYRYIPTSEIQRERGGDNSKFILRETAQRKLAEINSYEHKGQSYKFKDKDIAEVVDELDNIPLEGLVDTSKTIYGMIMPKIGGKTIKVFHDGGYESKSFRYIDFEHPENNDFAVTVEFMATGKKDIRVDIAIFVNGIIFALVENKKSSVEIDQAIKQHLRNQNPNHCPKLYVYPQLLIAANKEKIRYATTNTPAKFYSNWRERSLEDEEWRHRDQLNAEIKKIVQTIIAKPIDRDIYQQILADLNGSTFGHTQNTDRTVTEQDLGAYGMLMPERLLDLCKNYVLFDAGIKKIMRYQQFFAIKKMLKRIDEKIDHSKGQRRKGGILWHTQGSGKSLSMVMFVKALIEHPDITNPRVLIVTDRRDLDRQIKGTFTNAGLKKDVIQAKSGAHLLKLIEQKDLRVITTLVHKFQSASNKRAGFVDSDQNIFVLIDEAHRSQGGDANLEMNRVIPNACYIAFTGTPILKEQKSKLKFGGFIDRYTIDDALRDEIILPLIYEGRYVDLHQDKKEVDRQTERLTQSLTLADKQKLQYKVKMDAIRDNPQRINEIAYDIEKHFLGNFSQTGLKAQIVAPSKFSAVLFQKYFSNNGNINTALVISDESGITDEADEHKQEVEEYLQEIKANYQSLQSFEKEVIDNFKYNDGGIEILIVVDKLLTGFDAPRNTVLYLARELKDHSLLQAIARVNRLFENDALPKTAGYIIDYSENAYNLKTAMELFGNFDENDVKHTLIDVDEKVEQLQQAYGALHDLFNDVKEDDEDYLQFLDDEPTRKQFYELLNDFLRQFTECMILQDFVHEFDEIEIYRKQLKKFMNLRKTASLRYAEDTDLKPYRLALTKIIDQNIKAEEAKLLTKQISINNKDVFEKELGSLGSDKSKAEAISAQLERTVKEKMYMDPEFYQRYSIKISKLLEELRQKKLADIEALKQARLLESQVLEKQDDSLPSKITDLKGADILYRNLTQYVEPYKLPREQYIETIADLVKIIRQKSVVDWQINNEHVRVMTNAIDDYLYDVVKQQKGIGLTAENRQGLTQRAIELARNNHEIYKS